jgi:hypothetical protein
MPNLHTLLSNRNWHALRALFRAHGTQFDNRWTKAQAVEHAVGLLTNPTAVRRTMTTLPQDAREALDTLVACEGAMPAHRFLSQFGPIRPYRPWRDNCPADVWRHPASPAERLWFLGLIFCDATPEGEMIVIPDELHLLLPTASFAVVKPAPDAYPQVAYPILDLAHVLTFLQTHDVRPLLGRWLAPGQLKALEAGLASPDPTPAAARSELQTGYVRFIHYLGQAAELVASAAGLLKPTPAAWDWIERPDAAQWRRLWDGWQTDLNRPPRETALWDRFRLPGERSFVRTVFDTLATLPAADGGLTVSLQSLAEHLHRRCIGAGTLPHDADVSMPLHALAIGPLTWAGLVHTDPGDSVALTEPGEWLLGRAEEPPTSPLIRPAVLQSIEKDYLVIALPVPPIHPPLRPLIELPLAVKDRFSRLLTRECFVALLSHGIGRACVVQGLRELTGGPLPAQALERLKAWEAEARGLTLRRLTVLTAADPQALARLSTRRATRHHIFETLSRHHVAVEPSCAEQLLRALRRDGHAPLVDPGVIPSSGALAHRDTGAAAHLWLALRVYLDLADLVQLPSIPPAALLDELAQDLDADQLSALAIQAGQASRRLRDALDGYTPFPAPLAGVDHASVLTTIKRALEESRPVEIVYHTAGRGERTTRVVEPLRFEERGGATYLVAYCRLRREERVFRLDRIEQAQPYTMR